MNELKQQLLAALRSRKLLALFVVVALVVLGGMLSKPLGVGEAVYGAMNDALVALFVTYCGGNVLTKAAARVVNRSEQQRE